jgi:hypothetical protein
MIVLPQLKVQARRVPLRPETIAGPGEKLAEAKKKYLSPTYAATMGPLSQLAGYFMNFLTLGGGWHPGEAEAKVLYLQDSRLQRMHEFDETAALITLDDPEQAKKLLRLRGELFRHPQGNESRFYRTDIQQHDRAP